jgi:RND family efflux transporter MFP subunit
MIPSIDASLELAASLLAAHDSAARSALISAAVVEALPDCACVLHRFLPGDNDAAWTAVGLAGDISVEQFSMATDSRLLAPLLAETPAAAIYPASQIQREDYAHLHVNRSIASLAYLPLLDQESLLGAVEVVAFSKVLGSTDIARLAPITRLASPALLAAEEFDKGRQDLLDSVHRMTQLYDLEKSLNATLELDEVTALASEKTGAMLECQAIHLWLFDGAQLRLMSSSGADATVQLRMIQEPGEGYVADMAEEGEPLLIVDPEDERLLQRNTALAEDAPTPAIKNALLVPLMQDGAEIGVLEAVNKAGDTPFNDDDQFFLTAIAETVSSALKNANLMFAERKLEILETLVRISSEITSTLRLERLLQIIVNSPQNVLPFERCAIALDTRGRLQLKAVSGMTSLPLGDAQVDRLRELLRWLATQDGALHLRRDDDAAKAATELPEAVSRHFETTGYRALYSLTLADDQGRVGVLLYEATDPDFLDLPHTEMIKILAGQATVAIRNALLYREVPLISLLEPLVQRKRALLGTSRRRRLGFAAGLTAAGVFLVFCPLPMRVSGEATIAPQHLVTIAAPVDGNVQAVFAHEGQRVSAGEVLGAMNDWQWRMDLTSAEAKSRSAELGMESDLARGVAAAGADRAQMEYLRSEAARARARLESAQLRSPIAGIVVTPALQNAAGEHLDAGAAFAQVLDLSTAVVDIAIPQRDAALLLPGQSAAIKLDSYPQRSWHGVVTIVSPQAQAVEGDRTFAARIPLANEDAVLHSGMTGRAKVFIGFRPAGYVLLRTPALWLWQTLWNWIGW